MLDRLLRHPVVRGATELIAAIGIYAAAIVLAYVVISQMAKLAAPGG